jgi:dTDP-L-rhamnose 4-epimerase
VRVIDSLVPQVHGSVTRPVNLSTDVEFIYADIRDTSQLKQALTGIEVVFHLAAEVGVGQSMYEITRYVGSNTAATAILLETLIRTNRQVEKLIIASSMSVYGEGVYHCVEHGLVYPALRTNTQLIERDWDMHCPICTQHVSALPTSETKPLQPTSIYAISKMDQELMSLSIGRAHNLPTVALRYFNVYGPRQSLSNPYTGLAAIFGSRLLNSRPPLIFEDGYQLRDFTHVTDIVQANILAMQTDAINFEAVNVGTGRALTVQDMAMIMLRLFDVDFDVQITNQFRTGDIRHCYADLSKIQRLTTYTPQVPFEDGIAELVAWMHEQEAMDTVEHAARELEQWGLTQ